MTSRERVLTALDHTEPDRVPIDLGGNQTGIHKFAYQRLVQHLGLDEPVVLMAAARQLARPSEAVLERLRVDTRYVWAGGAKGFQGGIVRNRRGGRLWHDLTDEFGVTWSMPDDSPYYMDISHSPLAGLSLDAIRAYPFPRGDDPTRFEGLRGRVLELRENTPYAVVSGLSGVVYEICWYLRGLENLFIDMMERPEVLEVLLDRTLEVWLGWVPPFLVEGGDAGNYLTIVDPLGGEH